MPVSAAELDRTFQRFLPNYGASLPDQGALERMMALWAEQLEAQPWVTDAVMHRARNLLITNHKDKWLPPFAVVLDYCHTAKAELERDRDQFTVDRALLALAAPDDPNALSEQEVKDVVWIKNWYARTLQARREAAYLDERLDPQTLAWQQECEAYEDTIGHLPDLSPAKLKAGLGRYRSRQDTGAAPA